jgi:hypothetical protein
VTFCLGLALAMCGPPQVGGGIVTQGTPAPGVFGDPGAVGPAAAALGFGLTHTRYSADSGDGAARAAARMTLAARPLPQDQAVMGWGTDNPEPEPGRYDFDSLDSRIALIRRTGGTPVLTLCCAPDWMKGSRPGTTDWSRLTSAPSPAHYADFAALAAKIARRYPDVTHFMVWNEFKGFWNASAGEWDYRDYTTLYNLVYRAIKKAAPHDLVGGPYLGMDSLAPGDSSNASDLRGPWGSVDRRDLTALEYWLRHKAGADFLVVDATSTTHDGRALPDPFTALGKFTAIGDWLRAHDGGLPVWWAEWYVEPDGAHWPAGELLAAQADAMIRLAASGAATAFYWNPQVARGGCAGCLWRGTEAGADGGTALPMMKLLRRFAEAFPPGTAPRRVPVGDPAVRALGGVRTVVAVNTTARELTTTVDGDHVTLPAYGVVWLAG